MTSSCSLLFQPSSREENSDAAEPGPIDGAPDALLPTIDFAQSASFVNQQINTLGGLTGTNGHHLVVFVVSQGEPPESVRIRGDVSLSPVVGTNSGNPTIYVYETATPPLGSFDVIVSFGAERNVTVAGVMLKDVGSSIPAGLSGGTDSSPFPGNPPTLETNELLLYSLACSGQVTFGGPLPVWSEMLGGVSTSIGLRALQGGPVGRDVSQGTCGAWQSAGLVLTR